MTEYEETINQPLLVSPDLQLFTDPQMVHQATSMEKQRVFPMISNRTSGPIVFDVSLINR